MKRRARSPSATKPDMARIPSGHTGAARRSYWTMASASATGRTRRLKPRWLRPALNRRRRAGERLGLRSGLNESGEIADHPPDHVRPVQPGLLLERWLAKFGQPV